MLPLALAVLAFVPMILEAWHAGRNDRVLRAAGAVEPAGDVYRLMQWAYPGSFLAMLGEAWLRGVRGLDAAQDPLFVGGLALFLTAKTLKYWAIATLGPRWSFRVLVPPGAMRITSGPYAYVRHPNYLAVAGELLGMALMAKAPLTGAAAVVGFSGLMLVRIRVEERELRLRAL